MGQTAKNGCIAARRRAREPLSRPIDREPRTVLRPDALQKAYTAFLSPMLEAMLVPDVAGWRRARLPNVPAEAYLTLAPDWICEVLSTSTEALDRGKKLRIHARRRGASWLVDPLAHTLEVIACEAGRRAQLGRDEGEATVRAAPFNAIELELAALWI